jgi:hypothetical protein
MNERPPGESGPSQCGIKVMDNDSRDFIAKRKREQVMAKPLPHKTVIAQARAPP